MAFTDKAVSKADDEELKAIIKELKKDLESLRKDMGDLQKDGTRFTKASASKAQHSAEDLADKVVHMARDKAEHYKHEAEEAGESLRTTVSNNPVASLGIAVAVGMVLGRRLLK